MIMLPHCNADEVPRSIPTAAPPAWPADAICWRRCCLSPPARGRHLRCGGGGGVQVFERCVEGVAHENWVAAGVGGQEGGLQGRP
eukprot:CAMPEP_0175880988 /NCGR_PEP_ID=MMETSP0107_2-20121207/42634_1 /TAXON_ID=195067 ORGANISM="Goniomonas pacifica, Strain CCMP1869" /NCGR_SAMPLE_ID=MMETSP0107_2 /ASSEMBLY_ACC=CAM_ASM_000203 /LENGTH=84 /DNA_ID=CAMNT_0017200815 /DNA_START=614 /DNA_END=868 /DNA_ORIENTATION=+